MSVSAPPSPLKIEHLGVRYAATVALHRASLVQAPRRITAILGPNGAGKSSLLKAAMGLVPAAFGSIQFASRDITTAPPEIRARLGIAGDQVALPQRLKVRTGLTQASGVRVVEVQTGSPAHASGLRTGDVIVGLDRDVVTGIDDIARILDGSRIDKRVLIGILREGALETIEIVPTERLPER